MMRHNSVYPMINPAGFCAQLIRESTSIACLTGAGISTRAGIPDFRGPQGLYVTRRYDPDKIFDIDYFYHDPKLFFEFARDFILLETKLMPTYTHQFLAQLERQGKLKGIVTQNIDSLHQRAGSKIVYEMHGSFWTSHCLNCFKMYPYETMKEKILADDVPHCGCQGVIKPDVVFFGENVLCYNEAVLLAESVDLFLIIGTSGVVYPAASIPQYAPGKIIVVNLQAFEGNLNGISLIVQEDIDEFFKKVNEHLV